MRNTKKAFTLVELIVVITILAILATVAFVSLGGQTDNARNTVKKDKIGKLATSIENARTNGLSLSAFVKDSANFLTGASIAGTGVTTADYNAGRINLAALDVKAEDFKDGTEDFRYAYTSKVGGKYELAATIKEGDLQKAYVVGTYAARGVEVLSGTIQSDGKTFKLDNTTDIKKVGYGDYINAGGTILKIVAVSPDYMKLTMNAAIPAGTTSISLASPESAGIIAGVNQDGTSAGTGVVNDGEVIPYVVQ